MIVSGGLGPTADDVTREATAQAFGRGLTPDQGALADLEARFRRFGVPMPPPNRKQADRIEGAALLANPLGTAPGQRVSAGDCTLFLLPGVPRELEGLTETAIVPWLRERWDGGGIERRVLKVACVPESGVEERITPAYGEFGREWITVLAKPSEILVYAVAAGSPEARRERLDRMQSRLRELIGDTVFVAARGGHARERGGATARRAQRERRHRRVVHRRTGGRAAHPRAGVERLLPRRRGGVLERSEDRGAGRAAGSAGAGRRGLGSHRGGARARRDRAVRRGLGHRHHRHRRARAAAATRSRSASSTSRWPPPTARWSTAAPSFRAIASACAGRPASGRSTCSAAGSRVSAPDRSRGGGPAREAVPGVRAAGGASRSHRRARWSRCAPALPPASWVPAERLHLTLAFLGEVEEPRVAALDGALRPVFAAAPRLRLRLAGPGTFPPGAAGSGGVDRRRGARRPRRGDERVVRTALLAAIERRVRAVLAAVLEHPLEDRPYHAHVTVARPRRPWGREAVARFRAACDDLAAEWEAARAVLMESELRRGGARYSVRRDYALDACRLMSDTAARSDRGRRRAICWGRCRSASGSRGRAASTCARWGAATRARPTCCAPPGGGRACSPSPATSARACSRWCSLDCWRLSPAWWGWAALAAVCGHVFSVFLRFRGGKGVATAAGALAAVSPLALGAAMVVFVAAVGLDALRLARLDARRGRVPGRAVVARPARSRPRGARGAAGQLEPDRAAGAGAASRQSADVCWRGRRTSWEGPRPHEVNQRGPARRSTSRTAIGILGAGSWGTALAVHLARSGRSVVLRGRSDSLMRAIAKKRHNPTYLPNVEIPREVEATADIRRVAACSDRRGGGAVARFPRRGARAVAARAPRAARLVLVSGTKGIEAETLARMSQVAAEEAKSSRQRIEFAALSGPTFAEELALGSSDRGGGGVERRAPRGRRSRRRSRAAACASTRAPTSSGSSSPARSRT